MTKTPNSAELSRVISNTDESDYDLVSEFYRIDDCCEVVWRNSYLSSKETIKAYYKDNILYFGTKNEMNPFYMAKVNDNKFSLFELSLKKYTELGF